MSLFSCFTIRKVRRGPRRQDRVWSCLFTTLLEHRTIHWSWRNQILAPHAIEPSSIHASDSSWLTAKVKYIMNLTKAKEASGHTIIPVERFFCIWLYNITLTGRQWSLGIENSFELPSPKYSKETYHIGGVKFTLSFKFVGYISWKPCWFPDRLHLSQSYFQPIINHVWENGLHWLAGNEPGTNDRPLISTRY